MRMLGVAILTVLFGGVAVVALVVLLVMLAPEVDEETAMRIIREWLPAGP